MNDKFSCSCDRLKEQTFLAYHKHVLDDHLLIGERIPCFCKTWLTSKTFYHKHMNENHKELYEKHFTSFRDKNKSLRRRKRFVADAGIEPTIEQVEPQQQEPIELMEQDLCQEQDEEVENISEDFINKLICIQIEVFYNTESNC